MVGLSTPRLIWVKRHRDDRTVAGTGGDDGAETLRTHDPHRGMTTAMARGQPGAAEVHAGLVPMLRFRWGVQANYFAWRIAENDLTGISGPQDNEKGLEDARRSLTF